MKNSAKQNLEQAVCCDKQWKTSGGLYHYARASQYIQESEWTFIEVELVVQSPLLPGTLLFVVKATGFGPELSPIEACR